MNNMMGPLNGLSAVVVAAYLAAVIYNGNLIGLLNALKGEVGYLEFIVALTVLYYLSHNKYTGRIATPLALFGIASAALIYVSANRDKVSSVLGGFAAGKIGMFDALKGLIGQQQAATMQSDLPSNVVPLFAGNK